MLPECVTAAELAVMMDLTVRRINMLAKEEGLPKQGRGQFNLKLCVQWFIDRALATKPSDVIMEEDELRRSQILLNESRKNQVDIDVDTKRRALIPAEEVKTVLSTVAVVFANGHESISGRLAGEVSPSAQKTILKEMREVRSIVSVELEQYANSLNLSEDNIAPTATEREPVGRAM